MVEISHDTLPTLADKLKTMTSPGSSEPLADIGFLDLGLDGVTDPLP